MPKMPSDHQFSAPAVAPPGPARADSPPSSVSSSSDSFSEVEQAPPLPPALGKMS